MPRSKTGAKQPPINSVGLVSVREAVLKKTLSLRQACTVYKVSLQTLFRFVKKTREQPVQNVVYRPQLDHHRVFTDEEEVLLSDYIEKIAAMQYELTKISVRKLAYSFALANNKAVPASWAKEGCAGPTWMTYFMKRRGLTIRKPEKRSKHRNACFNRTNVKRFHDNIADVQTRLGPFEAHQIWNIDETGCRTVQDPSKVVTKKGAEHVGAVTSAERAQLLPV